MDAENKKRYSEKLENAKAQVKRRACLLSLNATFGFSNGELNNFQLFYHHEQLFWIKENCLVRKRDNYHGAYDFFQFDVPTSTTIQVISEKTTIQKHIQRALTDSGLPQTSVYIVPEGGTEEIEVPFAFFLQHVIHFLNHPEIWILDQSKTWCIESLEDGINRIINLELLKQPIIVTNFSIEK